MPLLTLLLFVWQALAIPRAPTAAPIARVSIIAAQSGAAFDFDRTMRVDYFHTGGPKTGEILALDRVVNDGAWPGSRTQLVDTTNLGKYLFEVRFKGKPDVVYSRGFSSIYGEWETTEEVKTAQRTFHESLRFPWPSRAVTITLKKRQADNAFREIWSTDLEVSPASLPVNPAPFATHLGTVWTVFENGPPSQKVDLLILSEGYTAAELPKFHADVKRLVDKLFEYEPYKSRRQDFNVRALDLPSGRSGINQPPLSYNRTPLSAEYNVFGSERYILTLDNRALRDAAAAAPYEFLEILVNGKTYGGGGIFNDQATAAVDSAFSEYVFVHEFGHHFAGLADEYYTSDVAYATGAPDLPEPWEPNATALKDPATLKWRDIVAPGTPLPTPWGKDTFERESRATQEQRRAIRARNAPEAEMDALFTAQRDREEKMLAGMQYSKTVGAFEGASYEAKGLYRPETDCIMFTRDRVGFCRVCQRAIARIIDLYAR
jgi:hypothetical protein